MSASTASNTTSTLSISCDGYNSPVFVYHSDREQLITNIHHGERELDDFVVKLAQRLGKGISKRQPQVDATPPDGSRAQLTLGYEVSDHGTNYTIRQFKDIPYTPIDLINCCKEHIGNTDTKSLVAGLRTLVRRSRTKHNYMVSIRQAQWPLTAVLISLRGIHPSSLLPL